ncbi:GNAT family N-acetyltransferase [Streptomyces sp. NPDC051907]|uniref:GNAT family N-acetyltransferase n=1 Tax=Streptomyces sp. NPDC051907 TaxID=3155284 RepID=UPI00342C2694
MRDDLGFRAPRPDEQQAIAALDDSFTTDHVYEVAAGDVGFALRMTPVDPPLVKVFPEEEDEDDPEFEVVAVDADGTVVGYAAADVETWNRRLVVRQVTVVPDYRGRGVGGELMRRLAAHGRQHAARTAWLETSSANVPAVRAYRRMGFRLCGLDTSLYTGTASEGETALFMSRSLV